MKEAFRTAEAKQWREHLDHDAIEVLSLAESEAVRARVEGKRILPSRYAYRDKNLGRRRVQPDTPWKPKARLVVGGHVDPDLSEMKAHSDSPTVSRAALMLILQVATSRHWTASAGDVQAAFLNGLELRRELYMELPRSGVPGLHPRQLVKIKKGIFGLTESPRMWYERLVQGLTGKTFHYGGRDLRLRPAPLDPCVFFLQSDDKLDPEAYIAVHVDDLLLTAPTDLNRYLQAELSKLFPVDEWLEGCFEYIGSHIFFEEDRTTITQQAFVDGRLFFIDVEKDQKGEDPATEEQAIDNRSLIGALSWLAGQTRPDLQCGVALAQQLHRDPTTEDIRFTNNLARKAGLHKTEGIILWPVPLDRAQFLVYHDAGWANAADQRGGRSWDHD